MRVPIKPPDFRKEFGRLMQKAVASGPLALNNLASMAATARPVDEKGRYLHWDEFRFKPSEDGLDATDRWTLVRRAREARRVDTPFRDKNSAAFFFVKTDFMERALHEIDSQTRGGVRFDGTSPNRGEAKAFFVTSLIEEPFSSSVFEGAIATRDQAKKLIREGRPPRSKGERMILNNYNAIEFIKRQKGEPLTPAIVCELQRLVTLGTLDDPSKAGAFRTQRDKIVVEIETTGEILHDPPPARALGQRVDAICRFANDDAAASPFIHPIIRAIILHFMLAYDHPFVDGNGRSARALFYWSILKDNYWLLEYISISKQIKEAPTQYGQAFLETETDQGDLTYFIHNQLDMVLKAIKALYEFVETKKTEIAGLQASLSAQRLKAAFNHRQLELLNRAARAQDLEITIARHEAITGVSYLTARSDLEMLVKEGFLIKRKRGTTSIYAPARNISARLTHASSETR